MPHSNWTEIPVDRQDRIATAYLQRNVNYPPAISQSLSLSLSPATDRVHVSVRSDPLDTQITASCFPRASEWNEYLTNHLEVEENDGI